MNARCSTERAAIYISGGIGDALLHMGFAKALYERSGHPLTLVLSVPPVVGGLLSAQPYVERVISVRDLHADRVGRKEGMTQLLKSLELDTLFMFSFQTYVLRAAYRARIPKLVGFLRGHHFYNALFMRHGRFVRKGTSHPNTHAWLPLVFSKHGYPTKAIYPSLTVFPPAAEEANRMLAPYSKLIGLGLNASAPGRRYSAERFAELIARLRAHDPQYSFLLFGGADVADIAQGIRARTPANVPLLDITSSNLDLRVGHALVARCLAFASNDSMGLHLAVASGVPTVGLFGASPPLAYAPLLQPLLASGPGGMDGIDPADVADAVLAWLGRGNSAMATPPTLKVAPAVGRAVTS